MTPSFQIAGARTICTGWFVEPDQEFGPFSSSHNTTSQLLVGERKIVIRQVDKRWNVKYHRMPSTFLHYYKSLSRQVVRIWCAPSLVWSTCILRGMRQKWEMMVWIRTLSPTLQSPTMERDVIEFYQPLRIHISLVDRHSITNPSHHVINRFSSDEVARRLPEKDMFIRLNIVP